MLAALQERVVSLERELSAVKSQLQRDYKWKSYMETLMKEFFGRDVSREMQQQYGGANTANEEPDFLRRKNVPVPKTFLGSRIEDIILPGNRSYGNGREPNDNVKRTRYESDYQNQAQSSPANLQYNTSLSSDGGSRMDGNFTSGGWTDTSQGMQSMQSMQSNWNSGNNQNSFNSTGNTSDQNRYNTNRNTGNSTAVSSDLRRREQYRPVDYPSFKATPLMHANDMSTKQFSNNSNTSNSQNYEFDSRARRPAVGSEVVARDRSGEYDGGSFYPSGRSQTAHVTPGSSHYIPPLMEADSFPPPAVIKRARPSAPRGSTPINSQSNRSNNTAESAGSREDRRLAKRLIHQQRMFDKYGFRSGPELHAAIEAEKRADGDFSFTMTENVASESSAAEGANFPQGRKRPHRGGRNRGRRPRNFPSTAEETTAMTNEAEDNDTESAGVKPLVDYSDDVNMESFPGNPEDSAAGESND